MIQESPMFKVSQNYKNKSYFLQSPFSGLSSSAHPYSAHSHYYYFMSTVVSIFFYYTYKAIPTKLKALRTKAYTTLCRSYLLLRLMDYMMLGSKP